MKDKDNEALQSLCRKYLSRLKHTCKKHGLLPWLNDVIRLNTRKECYATKREVRMLSRIVDEERMQRIDVPKALNKTYRQCCEDDTFNKIGKLKKVGIYSMVDVLLMKS